MGVGATRHSRLSAMCLAACCLASLAAPQAAHAVVDDRDTQEANCALPNYNFKLQADPVVVGAAGMPAPTGTPAAPGAELRIDALSAKLIATKSTSTRPCTTLLFQIPQFQWNVVTEPSPGATSIAAGDTLTPTVKLGLGAGPTLVRLTACPQKCRLTHDGREKTVGPFTVDVTINVVTEFTPPPEKLPPATAELPLSRPTPPIRQFSYGQRFIACGGRFGGGVVDPQWVTAGDFNGHQDYHALEGETTWSKVADLDNPLNHDSQDFEWKTQPDAPYFGLPQPDPGAQMKTEWESGRYPRLFHPTPGDRTSIFGFRIFDCGHNPFKAEIHPPVGVATERPRPVHIPPSFRAPGFPNGFGQNVFVPGISTDVWFNKKSGELTRTCGNTTLHQPAKVKPGRIQRGPCIKERHSLNRTFTFNIYLPRNPQPRAQELGFNPPPMPLFIGTEKFSDGKGGPEPTITPRERNGVHWLEVSVDLSGLREDNYGRRISAAWAYPNPENWGASRWRINLKSMFVYTDSEPIPYDDGDWRVFFNTNNRDQEWSKVVDCDGCIETHDNRKLNLSTGGKLGPDTTVFPDQSILVHFVGYDDEIVGDDLGSIQKQHPLASADYVEDAQNGEAAYRMRYEIRPVGSVGPAQLTAEANALFRAYTGQPNPKCTPTAAPASIAQRGPQGTRAPLCGAAKRDPGLVESLDPDGIVLRNRVMRLKSLESYEPHESETFALTNVSVKGLRQRVLKASPRVRRAWLKDVKAELAAVPKAQRGDYNELVLALDRALPPRLVRQAVPRSVRRSVRRFRRAGRAFRRKRARQRARKRARRRARARKRRSGRRAAAPDRFRYTSAEFGRLRW